MEAFSALRTAVNTDPDNPLILESMVHMKRHCKYLSISNINYITNPQWMRWTSQAQNTPLSSPHLTKYGLPISLYNPTYRMRSPDILIACHIYLLQADCASTIPKLTWREKQSPNASSQHPPTGKYHYKHPGC